MKPERFSNQAQIWGAILSRPVWGKIILAVVVVLIVGALAWSGLVQAYPALSGATPAAQAGIAAITPTPTIDPVLVANQSQTNGVIVGGVFLVLIIIGGTLITIRRKPH
ncbi:MAG: hypothetical protein M1281_04910 [Chloroflexi bacterium]|nr:hypothetical protein [Chloroflexota bacterium]